MGTLDAQIREINEKSCIWEEMFKLNVSDYRRCIAEMKKAHPFMDDAHIYITQANPENYPHIVVKLDVNGTEITLMRRVSHEE